MTRTYQASADLIANQDVHLPHCVGKKDWKNGEKMGIVIAHAGTKKAAIAKLKKNYYQDMGEITIEQL